MPQLARYLKEAFERNCPKGWVCRTEIWFRNNNPAPKELAIQQEVSNAWRSLVDEIEALLDHKS